MAKPGGNLAQRCQPVGLLQLFAQNCRMRIELCRRARFAAALPYKCTSRQQSQHPQPDNPRQPPIGDGRRQARGRIGEQVQFPVDGGDGLDVLDHSHR